MFCVKLKTNAMLIREREAARIRDLGVESVQISIYSHRPEVHDAITLIPGSLKRSLDAIRFLKSQGLKVIIANVLMTQNMQDYPGVRALAAELGVECTLDPTITPMMDGNRSVLDLGVDQNALRQVFRDHVLWSATSRNSARSQPTQTKTRWRISLAAPATPPAMFRLTAKFFPASSFRCPRETCGSSALSTSGGIPMR